MGKKAKITKKACITVRNDASVLSNALDEESNISIKQDYTPEGSSVEETYVIDTSIEENSWPETSPYIAPAFTLLIGPSRVQYTVLQDFLCKCPRWAKICKSKPCSRTIALPELDESLGHTVVHYLYTGTYQTLKPRHVLEDGKTTTEYQRNIRLYCAARMYGLVGLELLTKNNIETFGQEISIFNLLDIAEEAYQKLPDDEIWFTGYITKEIKAAFAADETLFTKQRFFDHIGNVRSFTKAIVKSIVKIYIEKIASTANNDENVSREASRCEDPPVPAYYNEPICSEKIPCEEVPCEEVPCEEVFEATMDDPPVPSCYNEEVICCEDTLMPAGYDEPTCSEELPCEESPCEEVPCEEVPCGEVPCEEVSEAIMDNEELPDQREPLPLQKSVEDICVRTKEEKKGKKGASKKSKIKRFEDVSELVPEPTVQLESKPELAFEPEPKLELDVEENSLCTFRAQHLLEGDTWKKCKKCRDIIRQMALQLARERGVDEEGDEIMNI